MFKIVSRNRTGLTRCSMARAFFSDSFAGKGCAVVADHTVSTVGRKATESKNRLYFRTIEDTNKNGQFDKNDVEYAGLVKFDFLGLRTLTIIDWAVKAINVRRERAGIEPVDIIALPLDDPDTYALLSKGQTTAVFQFESRGMKEYIRKLQPSTFEDLIALAALYRPGPLGAGMVDDFIDRRHGRADVSYPHPLLEPILKPTYGVIVYQEQVMQIAQVLAGYSLGGADLLRRAMGKKKPEEMAKERVKFEAGAAERDIDPGNATAIFDLMEKFADYGFNKSHSAAYALVAYQTAWLKAHYPAPYALINVWKTAGGKGIQARLDAERRAVVKLAGLTMNQSCTRGTHQAVLHCLLMYSPIIATELHLMFVTRSQNLVVHSQSPVQSVGSLHAVA